MVRPDPMRKYFVLLGSGGGGSRFSEKFRVGKLCYLLLECFVFRSRNAYLYPI